MSNARTKFNNKFRVNRCIAISIYINRRMWKIRIAKRERRNKNKKFELVFPFFDFDFGILVKFVSASHMQTNCKLLNIDLNWIDIEEFSSMWLNAHSSFESFSFFSFIKIRFGLIQPFLFFVLPSLDTNSWRKREERNMLHSPNKCNHKISAEKHSIQSQFNNKMIIISNMRQSARETRELNRKTRLISVAMFRFSFPQIAHYILRSYVVRVRNWTHETKRSKIRWWYLLAKTACLIRYCLFIAIQVVIIPLVATNTSV